MRKIAALGSIVLVGACATATRTAAPPPRATARAAEAPACRDTHEQLHGALWMQHAVEYRMVAESIYRAATAALDAALADPSWSAAVEQSGDFAARPPAVILDLDETVLDNSRFEGEQARRRAPYDQALWREWVALRKAALVPGAKAFLDAARDRGVAVFFVSNRAADDEAHTVANLLALGIFASPENVLSVNENGWTSDKTARRRLVADTHRVVLLVGDDLGDFIPSRLSPERRAAEASRHAKWWGLRWFVLPNPMYGSWERALWDHVSGLEDREMLERKLSAVRGFAD